MSNGGQRRGKQFHIFKGRNYTDYTEFTDYRVNKTDGEMGKKSDEDPSHFWFNGVVLPLVCSFGIFGKLIIWFLGLFKNYLFLLFQ